jgi:predicted ATP-binding protein involved in virulence
MTVNTHLRIDKLKLRNFRCFEELEIDLHPELTVLVAENGQGKTAILDAIAIALGLFVDTITDKKQFHGLERADVRLVRGEGGAMVPVLPTEFEASGGANNVNIDWKQAFQSYGLRARTTTKDANALCDAAKEMRNNVINFRRENNPSELTPVLPLVAFYGTGRLWNEPNLANVNEIYSSNRFVGYTDCLSSSSSFKHVIAWYENKWREAQSPLFSVNVDGICSLDVVRNAVNMILAPTEWSDLDWDSERKILVVKHPEFGRLPLSALSDGVRNMIALVADIAHRCAKLNPNFRSLAARETPGVLLIDEVDMHLHPRWQQLIVELIRETFPKLQVILTTHSPHVLSTVDKESIRVIHLSGGKTFIEKPTMQTKGVESADVLAAIMRVDPVPQVAEAKLLSKYRALIEDGLEEATEAQELRSKLNLHFGESHRLMLDCDRLIRFQSFKIKKASTAFPK